MRNECAFSATNHIETFLNEQQRLFDTIRPDNNILDTTINYVQDIDNRINEITPVKKIDFMVWNYWRTVFEVVNAADLPQGVVLTQGNIKEEFNRINGQNNITAIDIRCKKCAAYYVKRHSEKFFKIYLVRQ